PRAAHKLIYGEGAFMTHEVRSTEWKIQGVGSAEIARGIAGGGSLFNFFNMESHMVHQFLFVGLGLGVSGKAKGKAPGVKPSWKPGLNVDDGSWDDLSADELFNGNDLHLSIGQVLSVGAAFIIGAQAM